MLIRGRPVWCVAQLAAIVCLLLLPGCDKNTQQELVRVESEKEANRILVELARAGITKADKTEVKEQRKSAFSITVPQADLQRAREILVQCDLPRPTRSGFQGMIDHAGMIPTRTEERAKLMNAMAEELSRTFETYDRVVSARVHIVLPEKDYLARDNARATPSASVLIKYTPLPAGMSPATEPAAGSTTQPSGGAYADAPVKPDDVQQIVARSVEGLKPEGVFVAYSRSEPLSFAVSTPPTPAPVAPDPASGAKPSAPAPALSADGAAKDRRLLLEIFAAAAVFAVISIVLTAMLVREKRRQRLAEKTTAEIEPMPERAPA